MKFLKGFKEKLNKKLIAVGATVAVVMTTMSITCFATDAAGTSTDPGSLPSGVTDFFTSMGKNIVLTIAGIAVVALGIYAAPQAIMFAKKIFKRVSG